MKQLPYATQATLATGLTRRSLMALTALASAAPATVWADDSTPGVTATEIRLGAVFPLTGPARLVTEPYVKGMDIAFQQANEAGGISGRKIKWLQEDDGYQPARTLAGAKRLVERDQVFLLAGQNGTPTTLAVMPYAEQMKIPFFTLVNPPDKTKRYTYGMTPSYADQTYLLTKYLIGQRGLKKIGYFYQNDDFGESGRSGVDRALKEANLSLAADVGFERGTTDFSTLVLKLRDSGADAVVSMAIAPSTGGAIKQALAIGYKPVWSTFSIGGAAPLQQVLGPAIDGLVFTSEVYTAYSDKPAVKELAALLAKYYPGTTLEWGVIIGYVQATVIVNALKAAGNPPTRQGVVDFLNSQRSLDTGLMAPISYADGRRTAATSIGIFEWEGGKSKQVTDFQPIAAGG